MNPRIGGNPNRWNKLGLDVAQKLHTESLQSKNPMAAQMGKFAGHMVKLLELTKQYKTDMFTGDLAKACKEGIKMLEQSKELNTIMEQARTNFKGYDPNQAVKVVKQWKITDKRGMAAAGSMVAQGKVEDMRAQREGQGKFEKILGTPKFVAAKTNALGRNAIWRMQR